MMDKRNTTILVVEDDPATRFTLRSLLQKQGYEVVDAAHGQAGVEAFASHHPHLVLLDVMMPVMDGFEACRRIREKDPAGLVPVLMLTAADDMSSIDHAFEAGASDFITKPINWPLLTQRVRYALRGREMILELRRNRVREAHAQRIARLGFWEWRVTDDQWRWSDEAAHLLGLPQERLNSPRILLPAIPEPDRKRLLDSLDRVRVKPDALEVEFRLTRPDGASSTLVMMGESSPADEGEPLLIGLIQDISHLRQAEARAEYLALHDPLTDLPNRGLFLRQGETRLLHSGGGARLILLFDIARFKLINDSLGHAVGDELLRRIADKLRQHFDGDTLIARMGADEFAILLNQAPESIGQARELSDRLIALFSEPFRLAGQDIFISLAVGAALYPQSGQTIEELLNHANIARLRAKQRGGGSVAFYCQEDIHRAENRLQLETELRQALDLNQFELFYQPQLDLRSQRIIGAEALLRWRHPERGLVPPGMFVPLMEEIGLIVPIGEWILREAARQVRVWEQAGLKLRIGVNISPRQFLEESFLRRVTAIIRETGVNPAQLDLEITESMAMHKPEATIALLHDLRALGLKIALDDFGVGYSSLEYLLRFPIQMLKVDRAFVKDITRNQSDRAIVRAVVAIAQSMGLTTVAEGVEELRQMDFLDALGIQEVQGYFVGKPMPMSEFEALARGGWICSV
ncbi:MAG: putative bifunctional diguanylate cyclase/phosphodiesterase [Pseudomonadota bacterium]